MPGLTHQVNLRSPKLRQQHPSVSFSGVFVLCRRFIPGVLVAIVLVTLGWYMYAVAFRDESIEEKQSTEQEALVDEVSRLIMLPSGETPRIATVVDPSQYVNDPLLSQSEVGDKVLVFEKAMKAVLYRPSAKRIVDVMGFEVPSEVVK